MKPLPNPSFINRPVNRGQWTQEDVLEILCDPCTVGPGPYPAVISDDEYVQVSLRMIKELGSEQFLVNMQFLAKQHCQAIDTMPEGRDVAVSNTNIVATGIGPYPQLISAEQWIRWAAEEIRKGGPARFMKNFVKEFKATMKGCTTSPQMGALLSALQRSD